jgi:16S rRNA (cytidine1402-2'-O)-methyltransferase
VPLIVVPTPLGNLRDVSLRALDELRAADVIAAEDTRTAKRLLTALGLPGKPLVSYREESGPGVTAALLERACNERVVLTSDAGMPGISDPGRELIAAARAAGVAIEVLPGPSAFVCAAVLSGFPLRRVAFAGFVPRAAAERREALRAACTSDATTVFYESPKRIEATLVALDEIAPDGTCFLARELTKLHEQQVLGSPSDVRAQLPAPVLGEIVLVLPPDGSSRAGDATNVDAEALIAALIDARLAAGQAVSAIAKELAALGCGSRNDVYRRVLARSPQGP